MNHELICAWLNIAPADWPPDHYTLLGLRRGEKDLALIEKHVHERLARLRCYQLSQPEQASAAMNLLAQAFSCLTNPAAKRTYDSGLPGIAVETELVTAAPARVRESEIPTERIAPVAVPTVAAVADTAVVEILPAQAVAHTQTDWPTTEAPPVRLVVAVAPPTEPDAKAVTPPAPVDPLAIEVERLVASRAAHRGLATRRQLLERVWLTRQLLREWQRIGKTLARLQTQPSRPADEADLGERLGAVAEYLRDFPRMLGRPGLPGYRVLALRRQRPMCKAVQDLDTENRKNLAKDWLAGHTLLLGYRRSLLRQLRMRRNAPRLALGVGAVRAWLDDHAGVILTVLGVTLLLVLICLFS
jgi:hypothetical protein